MIANAFERALVVAGPGYLEKRVTSTSVEQAVMDANQQAANGWDGYSIEYIGQLVEPYGYTLAHFQYGFPTPGKTFNSGQLLGLGVAHHMLPKPVFDGIRDVPVSDTIHTPGPLNNERWEKIRSEILQLALQSYEEVHTYHYIFDSMVESKEDIGFDRLQLLKAGFGLTMYRGRIACRKAGITDIPEIDWNNELKQISGPETD
jgi:hypothetical protein